jgi:nucleoside 2-deoxyribosyltransferase
MQIYLASPLGFSPENKSYLTKIKHKLVKQGHIVFCPWEQTRYKRDLDCIPAITDYQTKIDAYRTVASKIAAINEEGIRGCDAMLAVLDGQEVDSGTASEIGFASALGKACYGLRSDRRDSGDFVGLPINLQVLHFIETTGGCLFRRIDDIDVVVCSK